MHISEDMKLEGIGKLLLLVSLVFIFGFIGSISAATITVNPGHSIQSAINSANDGDTVVVNEGTYYENVEVNKEITLTANGNVNIVAMNNQDPVITVTTSNTVVKNFKLTNSLVGVQYYGSVSNNQLINNIIEGTGITYGNGISFSLGTALNNLVQGNTISQVLHGILFNDGNVNNVVDSNSVTLGGDGAGIYAIDGSSGMTISNNYVTNAQDSIACQSLNGGLGDCFTIIGNTLTDSVNGLWMKLSNSIIEYNTVTGCNISGYDVSGSNNKIINNTATSNQVVGIIAEQWGDSDNVVISGNVLTYNSAGINTNSPGATITNNYVWHNGMGIVSTGGSAVVTGNNVGSNSPDYIIQGTGNTQNNPPGQEYPVPTNVQPTDPPITPPTVTTDKTPPKVIKTSPKTNQRNISRRANVYIKFSKNIYKTAYWSKVYIKNMRTGKLLRISKSIKKNLITIKTKLKSSKTWYKVTISHAAIKDGAGSRLKKNYIYKFKTK